MSGRNVQRKLGTTRGSPRRSRTAKASRISRRAVKSRCAREWDGWGRLSDDGPGHYNPDPSEGPWGGGLPSLHGGALSSPCLPTQSGNIAATTRCTKGGCKPAVMQRMSGADLSCVTSGKAPSDKPAFQPYWGKPAVRNDREGRGNVGIIRSPIRASILPDCGGRGAILVPTATIGPRGILQSEHSGANSTSIQNGSSRLLISQVFLPRSVPNRHLQGALRTKRFFRTSVPNMR
jgi:hypothetical protein